MIFSTGPDRATARWSIVATNRAMATAARFVKPVDQAGFARGVEHRLCRAASHIAPAG